MTEDFYPSEIAGPPPAEKHKGPGLSARANHGGGGSRTRVRIRVLQGRYVRRSLGILPRAVSDQPIPRPAT